MKNWALFEKKKEVNTKLKTHYWLPNNKSTCVVALSNNTIVEEIIAGLKQLEANFIIIWEEKSSDSKNIVFTKKVPSELLEWVNAFITDSKVEKLEEYMKAWIVPIIVKENYLHALLREFNPMKNEGNAFIYDKENAWQIFYALCRFLENAKFHFDYQNLVNNVSKI